MGLGKARAQTNGGSNSVEQTPGECRTQHITVGTAEAATANKARQQADVLPGRQAGGQASQGSAPHVCKHAQLRFTGREVEEAAVLNPIAYSVPPGVVVQLDYSRPALGEVRRARSIGGGGLLFACRHAGH